MVSDKLVENHRQLHTDVVSASTTNWYLSICSSVGVTSAYGEENIVGRDDLTVNTIEVKKTTSGIESTGNEYNRFI